MLVMLILSGCGGVRNANVADTTGSQPVATSRVVTDDLGRHVTIPLRVTRVVSLAPNLTESIFAVGAGDRLVGVTTFCNYPEQAKSITKIGDTMNPNMESIVALKPDIVFVSTASQIESFTKTLDANGIAVYVTNPMSLDDVVKDLFALSEILGNSENSGVLANFVPELKREINGFRERMKNETKVRVFVQISKEPLFTIGKQSFLNEVIDVAGGESVTNEVESAYPKLSKETALALSPDVIILSESDDNREPNEVFRNSPAVKNGRVYKINADIISRPGPRLFGGLYQIARDLHPKKFPVPF